jgi:hypothetical protein
MLTLVSTNGNPAAPLNPIAASPSDENATTALTLSCNGVQFNLTPTDPTSQVSFKMTPQGVIVLDLENFSGCLQVSPIKSINNLFESGGSSAAGKEQQQHTPVHIEGGVRSRCAYCALMSRFRRTRYQCACCGVPLCSIGSGKVEDDCFTAAHATEDRQQMVCKKYREMQKHNPRQNKITT